MNLTACPQCNAPMANQCGATCQGCHYHEPCGSEPSPTITAHTVARTGEELAATLHRVSRPTLRVNHPLPIDPDDLAEALERSRGRVVAVDPDAGCP